MRRIAVLLSVPLLATLALAGCGSATTASSPSVSVKGQFGSDPTVSIPSQTAGKTLAVKTLIKGNGPALTKTDAFVGNYAVYIWSGTTHKLDDRPPDVEEGTEDAAHQDPGQGTRPGGGHGPDRRHPVRGRDLPDRQGLR